METHYQLWIVSLLEFGCEFIWIPGTRRQRGFVSSSFSQKHTSHGADHLVAALRWYVLVQNIDLEHAILNAINWLLARGSAAQFVPVWWLLSTSLGSIIRQSHPAGLSEARLTVTVHNGQSAPLQAHHAHITRTNAHVIRIISFKKMVRASGETLHSNKI